ncbi:MAG: hypothetical protein PF487_03650 [Bacteroidales bacterium]|jgi:hypothetical protein|nr:hypothetical protein [Bacteroidales bacterium]
MKQKFIIYLLLIFSSTLFFSCDTKQKNNAVINQKNSVKNTNLSIIADTIITDVLIKNSNSDDTWKDYCLRNLDNDTFVNTLFEAIYSKKLQAFDFFNGDSLTISEIHNLEKSDEFNRSLIAKIQFEEQWLFNKSKLTMQKKVYSIMLAYEIYNSEGEIKGYKPAFKVFINQ